MNTELLSALKDLLRHCVTVNGFPEKGKGRTEDQQRAFDAARAAIAKAEAAKPPTIGIVLEGGLVSCIVSDNPAALASVRVLVIDYDTEGAEISDVSVVPQGGGALSEAVVSEQEITEAAIQLDGIKPLHTDPEADDTPLHFTDA